MDLLITFPGQVVDGGGGKTDYNRVHFERGWGLGAMGKTRIVALNHAGPPWWVLAAGGGALVGALLTLALVLLPRRRPQAHGTDEAPGLAPMVDGSGVAEDGDQSAFWASEGADHPSQPVAVPIAHLPGPLAEPVDHSMWAPPEQD